MTYWLRHGGFCMSAIDNIKHVVVLILENHSFDQMLGCMNAVYPDLDGIDLNNLRDNVDDKGTRFFQKETDERQMKLDPHHEVEHVDTQLKNDNGGFILDFVEAFPEAPDSERQNIMGYYKLDSLPGLHQLARNYTVCDHWFSSLPGPTWPNRFSRSPAPRWAVSTCRVTASAGRTSRAISNRLRTRFSIA
jgi:phospholipase C